MKEAIVRRKQQQALFDDCKKCVGDIWKKIFWLDKTTVKLHIMCGKKGSWSNCKL